MTDRIVRNTPAYLCVSSQNRSVQKTREIRINPGEEDKENEEKTGKEKGKRKADFNTEPHHPII